jgi:hypothetical protein
MLAGQRWQQMQIHHRLPIQHICRCTTERRKSIHRTTSLHNRKLYEAKVNRCMDNAADQQLDLLFF